MKVAVQKSQLCTIAVFLKGQQVTVGSRIEYVKSGDAATV